MAFCGQTGKALSAENTPPAISIIYPQPNSAFVEGMFIRIKAGVSDCAVSQVQFFAETNLIGVVTNAPYEVWWTVTSGIRILTAVATSHSGINSTSPAVKIAVLQTPSPFFIYGITSPANGQIFLAPATITFSAELLAGINSRDPTAFCVGTNIVGILDGPPYSITVSNLNVGDYSSVVKKGRVPFEEQPIPRIRVVDLAVALFRINERGHVALDILTGYPRRKTVIQASPNLRDWSSISTNFPETNSFQFVDFTPIESTRFYRVVVLP